jgi:hypothetical protein
MHLNEATLIVAVQEYFDRQFAEGCAPIVKSVQALSQGYDAHNAMFEISTVEKQDDEASDH